VHSIWQGNWELAATEMLFWAMIRPMALFPTVETSMASSLRWSCLVVLVGCWGRKARCLIVLAPVQICSLLVVLTVLLMLRKLSGTAIGADADARANAGAGDFA
jgi:hypothetical protein